MFARATVLVSVVFASLSLLAFGQPEHRGQPARKSTATAAEPAKPVNSRCPIQSEEVDPDTPVRTWRGHAIGFCCPGCDQKWDAKTDAEKDEFLAKHVGMVPTSPAVELARRFQSAMAAGDIAAFDPLLIGNGGATVFENGSDEGPWERYRDEHLGPELKELAGYQWTTKTETETPFGASTLVCQTGTFTIGPATNRRAFAAAITFVVVEDEGEQKVAHMHWSSREIASDSQ